MKQVWAVLLMLQLLLTLLIHVSRDLYKCSLYLLTLY